MSVGLTINVMARQRRSGAEHRADPTASRSQCLLSADRPRGAVPPRPASSTVRFTGCPSAKSSLTISAIRPATSAPRRPTRSRRNPLYPTPVQVIPASEGDLAGHGPARPATSSPSKSCRVRGWDRGWTRLLGGISARRRTTAPPVAASARCCLELHHAPACAAFTESIARPSRRHRGKSSAPPGRPQRDFRSSENPALADRIPLCHNRGCGKGSQKIRAAANRP